jgi:large subunit ribosomal protein L21
MEAYAVVQTGGKQYLVQVKDTLKVERLSANKGEQIDLKPVLAVSDGKTLTLGAPALEGAKVAATVVDHIRGEKVISFKRKKRKGFRKKKGHRQEITVLKIEAIG